MHGTQEWLPGSPLGAGPYCWPDKLLGNVPHLYVYAANNPAESALAKRRAYATIVSHGVPPYGRAGLYKELAALPPQLAALTAALDEAPPPPADEPAAAAAATATDGGSGGGDGGCGHHPPAVAAALAAVVATATAAGLDADTGRALDWAALRAGGGSLTRAELAAAATVLGDRLAVVANRLYSVGLHVFGRAPTAEEVASTLSPLLAGSLPPEDADLTAAAGGGHLDRGVLEAETVPAVAAAIAAHTVGAEAPPAAADGGDAPPPPPFDGTPWAPHLPAPTLDALATAATVGALMRQTPGELDALSTALDGGYVRAAPGGDVLRDGPGVLPTGRNIHSLDPYRLPSPTAAAAGAALAEEVVANHAAAHGGRPPATVAVPLWGLDAIKTRGEAVGLVLGLVGAAVVRDATGRVVRFELRPLAALGRPRVDVLVNLSGIFRDSFAHTVELLDDMFRRAAAAEEDPEWNFVRAHALAAAADAAAAADGGGGGGGGGGDAAGVGDVAARLFSNAPESYGSQVAERVQDGTWEAGEELADTYVARNAYAYGRSVRGAPSRPALDALLATTEAVVQQIDSVEYGLTDIQEYHANTGALVRAARAAKPGGAAAADVSASIVEAVAAPVMGAGRRLVNRSLVPLDDLLRTEYRAKLLNPAWAAAMLASGPGGAYEVSTRATALIGWGGAVGFGDAFVYEQLAGLYVTDAANRAALRGANPEAYRNVVGRLLEGAGRGLWADPPPALLNRLRE
ncbi:hypothetical protein BU14_2236s0001, partial [Porphyra umbilicalis]